MSAQTIHPSASPEDAELRSLFPGDSELAQRMRAFDWSRTPLGAPQYWPENLRIAVRICLTSRFPMHVWWGPSLTLFYNDAYISFLGPVKHPAVLGRSGREAWPEIWDTIGPMIDAVFTHASANWSEDILMFFDREIPKEEVYVTFSFSPILGAHDKVEGIFCACTETTEKLVSNRRLETLRKLGVEAAIARTVDRACAAAIAVLGENPRDLPFAAIYLVDPADGTAHLAHTVGLAASHPLPRTVSPDDAASAPLSLASVLKTKQPSESGELGALSARFTGGPWSEAVRNVVVLPIHAAAHDTLTGLLVAGVSPRRPLDAAYRTFYDLVAGHIGAAIADAKAYDEEKRRAEALTQLDRAKTAFFSNISHEFRTPLTLMLGPTEDALSSPERALSGVQLETVHRNQLRLLRLVNTLLDFARVEAGREQAVYQATDLAALTTDLASTFRSAVERGGLQLDVDCPPLPQPAYVDRAMWEKIVLNLLSNAFKYTFEGGIRVALRAVDGRAELEVRDTGVGIAEHELPRVFERFHRIEGTRARTYDGSGIGLALVHDLVQLHGGTIGVTSRVGEGTTFSVSIPLDAALLPAGSTSVQRELAHRGVHTDLYVTEALRWIAPSDDAATALRLFPRTARVLVVDDNADMRDYMVRLLQPHWEIQAVNDGAQALAAIRAHQPDLVLTDVMMPNVDGFQLLRALRDVAATARIPVIILSARAGEELRIQGLRAGADDYLVKPFSAKELVARVATHLELSRLRRQAETERDRFRSLLSQVPAVVNFLRGPDLVFELAHPLTVKFLGGRELHGKRLLDVIPEIRDQPYYDVLQRVLRTGEPASGEESLVQFDRSNTGVFEDSYWNYIYLPVYSANGEIEGVMTFDIEVTDQVRARRRSEALMEELKASDRRKDEFLAMLAHELRNPLAPLRTSMYIVRKQLASAPVNRHLDVIERQAGNLARIVDDLLDVSRITRGKIELRKERVDIAQAVTRALEATGQFIESRKHEVSVSLPLRPIYVEADPVRLDQIVTNLLTNAAKYTDPGGRIWVSIERAGDMAELRVRDNGVGIAEDLRPHLFDLFQQGNRDLSRALGGLGIGLTIVRNLVELHGGSVDALSEGTGKGSEFVVRIPYIKEEGVFPDTAVDTAAQRAVARSEREVVRRVLVVDDNKDAADSLAELIGLLGHDVRVVLDGPAAIEVTEQWRPDLLFLDIGLPGMDGYQVAKRLRGNGGPAPLLVALTGYGQESDRRKTREAGFSEHLVKPPAIQAIEAILEASIDDAGKRLH